MESIKKCPKAPLVMPIYACGLLSFAFYNKFVFGSFINEEAPCPSCALSRFAAIMVGSGALFPAVITPPLAHYIVSSYLILVFKLISLEYTTEPRDPGSQESSRTCDISLHGFQTCLVCYAKTRGHPDNRSSNRNLFPTMGKGKDLRNCGHGARSPQGSLDESSDSEHFQGEGQRTL